MAFRALKQIYTNNTAYSDQSKVVWEWQQRLARWVFFFFSLLFYLAYAIEIIIYELIGWFSSYPNGSKIDSDRLSS